MIYFLKSTVIIKCKEKDYCVNKEKYVGAAEQNNHKNMVFFIIQLICIRPVTNKYVNN